MTHDDDLLDPGTAERLAAGSVSPADAPPGYAPVAALLASAAVPSPVPDLDFDALARVARRTADQSGPSKTRRSPMLGKLLTVKAAAVAGVILIGASGAAAATGALPSSMQRAAHDTLSHVGVSVPDDSGTHTNDPAHHEDAPDAADPTTSTTTTGVDGSVPPGAGDDSHGGTTVDDPADSQGDNSQGGTDVGDDPGSEDGGDQAATTPTTESGDDGGDQQSVPTTIGSGGTDGSGDRSGVSGSGGSGSGDSGSGGGSSSNHD